jgi:hypothetical protein
MRAKLRSPLAILAIGAIVFATVFAAASSLTVATDLLPQSGSSVTASCDTNGVSVGYTVSGANVTKIVVTGDDCATGTITLATTAGYTFVESATQANAATVTYTLGAVGGAAAPITIVLFNPGTVTVTLLP